MKSLLTGLVAVLIAAANPAFASPQHPDRLILDGKVHGLESEPLSPLLRAKVIELPASAEIYSSNWRGYVATWALVDGQLFLRNLEVTLRPEGVAEGTEPSVQDVIARVFRGRSEVPAEWFSGALVIPAGAMTKQMPMGYGTTYERYIVLDIVNGMLLSRHDLSSDQYDALRRRRFAAYQKTDRYTVRYSKASETVSPSDAERFLYEELDHEYMSVPR